MGAKRTGFRGVERGRPAKARSAPAGRANTPRKRVVFTLSRPKLKYIGKLKNIWTQNLKKIQEQNFDLPKILNLEISKFRKKSLKND